MIGEYPVIVNGQNTGTLSVSKDGIMTVFDARCKDSGELLRLSVYGDKEAYLGVMAPDGGGEVHLHKRLSRAALADFPETIRYAAPAGMKVPEDAVKPEEEELPEEPAPEPEPEPESVMPPDDCKTSEVEERPQVHWRHGAGGALVGTDSDRRYLAIPIKAGVIPVGGDYERRMIDDTEYAVFEIKKGT